MYKAVFKRGIDVVFTIVILFTLSPIFILIILLLFMLNNQEVFFTQLRPGKNEKIFKLIKFKTMNNKKDEYGELLPDFERMTKIGSILRNYSLDEIPQLFNVLKGEMSLIGPRPLLVQYLPLYNSSQKRRHEVKPGISGWAQVNGRNAIDWEQKFKYDVWYVDNLSFLLDLKILFLTIFKVFINKDVNQSRHQPMKTFKGS